MAETCTTVLAVENWEDGVADGWSFPTTASCPAGTKLWHITQNNPIGSYVLGYVQAETVSSTPDGNFNVGNVNCRGFGPSVTLPTVSVAGHIDLIFSAFVGDEWNVQPDSFDTFRVEVSLDGTTIDSCVAASNPMGPGGGGTPSCTGKTNIVEWDGSSNAYGIDYVGNLTAYGGQTIYPVVMFAPLDGVFNNYPGPRVDNISIQSCDTSAPTTTTIVPRCFSQVTQEEISCTG